MKKLALIFALILSLALLPAYADGVYQMGETIDDFSVTTPQGEVITLSGLLKEHKAVLINFWFINCGWCDYEFPFLQQAYEELSNDVAVLALSPYDKSEDIAAYQAGKGLTFPMAEDSASLSTRFGCTGFPTTVVIDRYGVYCFNQSGAFPSAAAFQRLMKAYAAEDYTASLVGIGIPPAKPDQPMPSPEKMAAALSAPGADIIYSAHENAWPWLLHENGYAFSSNSGEDSTSAILQADFQAAAGDVLAFDYKTSSGQHDDCLALYIDSVPVKVFFGEKDWQTFAIPLPEDGQHTALFAYMKNNMYSSGDDMACIDNLRVLSGDEAAAALALSSVWPQALDGTDVAFDVRNEGARRVIIDDPSGTLETYYPDAVHYIAPGSEIQLHVRIGKMIDPEAAILYASNDGGYQTLSTLETDETGYLATLPTDSLSTTGFPWNCLLLYPYFNDYQTALPLFYFASEDDLNHFCQYNIAENTTAAWQYADEKAAYTLLFRDQNGAPVAGVIANICDETTCMPMVSDENGLIQFENAPYPYDIHVIRVPEGYAFDLSQAFTAPEAGGEMQFTLTKN